MSPEAAAFATYYEDPESGIDLDDPVSKCPMRSAREDLGGFTIGNRLCPLGKTVTQRATSRVPGWVPGGHALALEMPWTKYGHVSRDISMKFGLDAGYWTLLDCNMWF